ncbi:hypothetical protein FOPG_20189 [Fusarium oxysporum f. sp. conglutinans race 2 54008]|uniref:Uncharacterized protein n=1 Tax=Fusarium oxysporum f. sp. conglutinans race 2 54008 TaxID=1089457 RepID=X0GIR9_FUSOX|nr:hypothetical protein FOPG_20189 [Fusarium oxysporum f. sp. conglutinans race 2 54008]
MHPASNPGESWPRDPRKKLLTRFALTCLSLASISESAAPSFSSGGFNHLIPLTPRTVWSNNSPKGRSTWL